MQVSVETTSALERRMQIQVPAQQVDQAINQRLQSLSRTVKLKGFRPGKVPVTVVKQQFGAQVRQEVIESLVQSTFAKAVSEQKLNPAGGPRIEDFSAEAGQDLRYRAIFEVYPEFELQGVEQMKITRPVVEVAEGDIDAMIENLRRQQATYVKVDRAADDNDRVTVDFEGKLDGQPFEGGSGTNVPVVIGAGRMLLDFEAGLKGVRAGDAKEFPLNFPAEYAAQNLAGKQAIFSVKVLSVEEQQLPEINDEFCKRFGIEEGGIAKLREAIAENMRRELADNIRARLRQQLFEGLLAANTIELPNSLVQAQVQDLQMEAGRRMGAREASQLPPAEQFQDAARRRVALGLLVGAAIKTGGLVADRNKVQAKLQDFVQQYQDPLQALKSYRENPDAQRQLENLVLEEQVIDWLLERAQVSDQPGSFKEVMNFGS